MGKGWFVDMLMSVDGPFSDGNVLKNRSRAAVRNALKYWKKMQKFKGQQILMTLTFADDAACKHFLAVDPKVDTMIKIGSDVYSQTSFGANINRDFQSYYVSVIQISNPEVSTVVRAPFDKMEFFGDEVTYARLNNMMLEASDEAHLHAIHPDDEEKTYAVHADDGVIEDLDKCNNVPCKNKPDGDERFSICGNCKMTRYCSRTCQKQDWSRHKAHCKKIQELRARKSLAS